MPDINNITSTKVEVTISEEHHNKRLDRALADIISTFSRSRIKSLIEAGNISTTQRGITNPSYRVKQGQVFDLLIPDLTPAEPKPENIDLVVVYEDNDLIVIDKPAGLVVHPAPGNNNGTLVNALLFHCDSSLSGIGGVKRPGIVHRIDKNTSGLLVVAKNDHSHNKLAMQFRKHDVDRSYLAIVWGIPRPKNGRVENYIGRSPKNRKKMTVLTSGGKHSLTNYTVTEYFGSSAALVECQLKTGRTHQIRVHMSYIGHPLIGDPVYGGGITASRRRSITDETTTRLNLFHRQALHAKSLGFMHPTTGKKLRFEAALPDDMYSLVCLLKQHSNN